MQAKHVQNNVETRASAESLEFERRRTQISAQNACCEHVLGAACQTRRGLRRGRCAQLRKGSEAAQLGRQRPRQLQRVQVPAQGGATRERSARASMVA